MYDNKYSPEIFQTEVSIHLRQSLAKNAAPCLLRSILFYAKLVLGIAFKPLAYMGINISGGHRPYTLAAMDANFHLDELFRRGHPLPSFT